jgi:hypothetical protein
MPVRNSRFRRNLDPRVLVAEGPDTTRPRHCPPAPLIAALGPPSAESGRVHGAHMPLSHAGQLVGTRTDGWRVTFMNGSGGSSSLSRVVDDDAGILARTSAGLIFQQGLQDAWSNARVRWKHFFRSPTVSAPTPTASSGQRRAAA